MAYENKKRRFIDNFSKDKMKRVALSVLALSVASPMAVSHFDQYKNNNNIINVSSNHNLNTSDKFVVKESGKLDKTHKDGAIVMMNYQDNSTGIIQASDDKKHYEFIFDGDAKKNPDTFNKMSKYALKKATDDGMSLTSNIQDKDITKNIDVSNLTGRDGQIIAMPRQVYNSMKARGITSVKEVSHETVQEKGLQYKSTSEKIEDLKKMYNAENKLNLITINNEVGIETPDVKIDPNKENVDELKKENDNLNKMLLNNLDISSM